MLKLRLVRLGKKKQPFFRIVVAEQKKAVQGKFIEVIGHYNPINKDLTVQKDRVSYWISKGAKPTDSVAVLFKKEGIADMDKYIDPRKKKRKKKKESEENKSKGDKSNNQSENKKDKQDVPKEVKQESEENIVAEKSGEVKGREEDEKEDTGKEEPKEGSK